MNIIVTGGAGFIGSAVCRYIIGATEWNVVNLDKLTYAANLESLAPIAGNARYRFVHGDIADSQLLRALFKEVSPDAILNLAAESHVDRSIDDSVDFINTNIVGVFTLLQEVRRYFDSLPPARTRCFRFHHVSTDEVFGDLGPVGCFVETTPYNPSSPYAASKAASDHLVRAWSRTYGLPVLITNCSNNYGPYQFPKKLIPKMILSALKGKPLPVYGKGENVRDWLYVEDHAEALITVLTTGEPGSTYNIGGSAERRNVDVVSAICDVLDEIVELLPSGKPRRALINFVEDRPGHDRRYAIDASRLRAQLGWRPTHDFHMGLRKTVQWYVENESWWQPIVAKPHVLDRIGLGRSGPSTLQLA